MKTRPWAVVLAGGSGSRLRSLTRMIAGDDRPKQFCPVFGSSTLLTQTRARLQPLASAERTVFVVVKAHEPFYQSDLADVDPGRIIIQPSDKGTTAAIAYALYNVAHLDEDAMVGFFPTDHHDADTRRFHSAVKLAYRIAARRPDSIVLLGAPPHQDDSEYGWIQPGPRLRPGLDSVYQVRRFWEKPSPDVAEVLLASGCVWNTFVMVGRVKAFLDVLVATVPEVLDRLQGIIRTPELLDPLCIAALYRDIPSEDFSRCVLSRCADRLAVLMLGDAGWSDLGTPKRIFAALDRTGVSPAWHMHPAIREGVV